MPELRRMFTDIPPPIELPAEQQRWYFFNAYRAFVERACRMAPIVAVFEDLHCSVALARQAITLLREHGLPPRTTTAVLVIWLAISLPVGGQCAWYLRPFFGVSVLPAEQTFFLGTAPDWRGATNFFEAVTHLISPPPRERGSRSQWEVTAPPSSFDQRHTD